MVTARDITGEVVRVDRFGNLITNIDRRTFEQFAGGGTIAVSVGGRDIAAHRRDLRRRAGR